MTASLTDGETRILDLHDAGESIDTIAARTNYKRSYVENVIARYAVTDRVLGQFDKMVAAGTASLLAAIKCFHPEVFTQGHP